MQGLHASLAHGWAPRPRKACRYQPACMGPACHRCDLNIANVAVPCAMHDCMAGSCSRDLWIVVCARSPSCTGYMRLMVTTHFGQQALVVDCKDGGEDLLLGQVPRGSNNHDAQRRGRPETPENQQQGKVLRLDKCVLTGRNVLCGAPKPYQSLTSTSMAGAPWPSTRSVCRESTCLTPSGAATPGAPAWQHVLDQKGGTSFERCWEVAGWV